MEYSIEKASTPRYNFEFYLDLFHAIGWGLLTVLTG
jgi:hypothetical protein